MSGFAGEDRAKLRHIGLNLGAEYDADMFVGLCLLSQLSSILLFLHLRSPACTHLVARYLNSARVQDAKQRGTVIIVNQKWLEECNETKIRINEKQFKVI